MRLSQSPNFVPALQTDYPQVFYRVILADPSLPPSSGKGCLFLHLDHRASALGLSRQGHQTHPLWSTRTVAEGWVQGWPKARNTPTLGPILVS